MYGLILAVMGLLDSPAEIDKAQGVRINLWAGLGMLAVGALFLLWQWRQPAEAPEPRTEEESGPATTGNATTQADRHR